MKQRGRKKSGGKTFQSGKGISLRRNKNIEVRVSIK